MDRHAPDDVITQVFQIVDDLQRLLHRSRTVQEAETPDTNHRLPVLVCVSTGRQQIQFADDVLVQILDNLRCEIIPKRDVPHDVELPAELFRIRAHFPGDPVEEVLVTFVVEHARGRA